MKTPAVRDEDSRRGVMFSLSLLSRVVERLQGGGWCVYTCLTRRRRMKVMMMMMVGVGQQQSAVRLRGQRATR
ncbi:hypothetical protein EYF80_054662 [Liparis tanakae]|uniref:Uncharacterized protein n=1 Tax=Liparis tanakae TaxID=230148 RepID=A0A4Z2F3B7_9TELE|nr:hypothetical protein EYF80_054662 [Liparis tanakae]